MSLPSSSQPSSQQKKKEDLNSFIFSEKSQKTNYFITDGGIETHMIYLLNQPLRQFSLFEELLTNEGTQRLDQLYGSYLKNAARKYDRNIILGSPTWRANRSWMEKLGYFDGSRNQNGRGPSVREVNEMGVKYARQLRDRFLKGEFNNSSDADGNPSSSNSPYTGRIIIAGDVGPRGDGYKLDKRPMSVEQAYQYHRENVEGLVSGGAELIQGITMKDPVEASGIALAAREFNIPCSIIFCCESDGRVSNGMKISDAIDEVDQLVTESGESTSGYVSWFGLNCAHPMHLERAFESLVEEEKEFASILDRSPGRENKDGEEEFQSSQSSPDHPKVLLPANSIVYSSCRLLQIRVNASRKTHAELDKCNELDAGDPVELAKECLAMVHKYNLRILGGCCGTDDRHIAEMARLLKDREENEAREREDRERKRKESFLRAAGGVAGIGLQNGASSGDCGAGSGDGGAGSNDGSGSSDCSGSGSLGRPSSSTSSSSSSSSSAGTVGSGSKGGQLVRDGELELKLREQRLMERLSNPTNIRERGVEGA